MKRLVKYLITITLCHNFSLKGQPVSMPISQDDIRIHVRSYAPYETFGGANWNSLGFSFEGDNRGPSFSFFDTSRSHLAFTIDLEDFSISDKTLFSDESVLFFEPFTIGLDKDVSSPRGFVKSRVDNSTNSVTYTVEISGANPITPEEITPAIDLILEIQITKNGDNLSIKSELKGDAFPNAEVFAQDSSGQKIMILTYEVPQNVSGWFGDVAAHLGTDADDSMGKSSIRFEMDELNNFKAVEYGQIWGPEDNLMNDFSLNLLSINDWNGFMLNQDVNNQAMESLNRFEEMNRWNELLFNSYVPQDVTQNAALNVIKELNEANMWNNFFFNSTLPSSEMLYQMNHLNGMGINFIHGTGGNRFSNPVGHGTNNNDFNWISPNHSDNIRTRTVNYHVTLPSNHETNPTTGKISFSGQGGTVSGSIEVPSKKN